MRLNADGREWGNLRGWGGEPDPGVANLFELLLVAVKDEVWQDRAVCAQTDPEAFYPEKGGSTREAKRICLSCEVKDECLEYALAREERFGIWGGLSERERRKFRTRKVKFVNNRRRLPDEVMEDVLELLVKGLSDREIAAKTGVHHQTVARHRRLNGDSSTNGSAA